MKKLTQLKKRNTQPNSNAIITVSKTDYRLSLIVESNLKKKSTDILSAFLFYLIMNVILRSKEHLVCI